MSYYNHYKNDPKKMSSRFPGTCEKCQKKIKKGETIIYFPKGKHVFCESCGHRDYQEFIDSAYADEGLCSYPSF